MQVLAIRNSFTDCPPDLASLGFSSQSQTLVSLARDYEVYALAVYRRVTFLQILNDLKTIVWLPAWLFEVRKSAIPSDWVCNIFQDEPSLIIGPQFVAKDIPSYGRMVELEPEPVQLFWERIRKSEAEI